MRKKFKTRFAVYAVLVTVLVASIVFTRPLFAAEPLHLYLTYSGAPETTIDINVLMNEKTGAVDIYYDTESRTGGPSAYRHHVKAVYHRSLMELADDRAIYTAALEDLTPGTDYYFIAGDPEDGFTKEKKFRTLSGGNAPLRFINGGDMGVDGLAIKLLKLAAKENPDFAIIGGDLAYENGLLGDYRIYDRWLSNWEEHMVTRDGRMIPIVTAIGNHETNDYESEEDEPRAPWYIGLFGRQGDGPYYSRRFGDNMVLICLDSGHLRPHGGAQSEWLAQELEKYKDVPCRIAAYHVPLYPAHRAYDGAGSAAGREHWGPIFDRYQLTLGLEHHDHVFKRSKPLRGNQVVDKGTVYIGDGSFGRPGRTVDPELRWYLEKQKSAAHFWVIEVKTDGIQLQAIDDNGETLDRFSLP